MPAILSSVDSSDELAIARADLTTPFMLWEVQHGKIKGESNKSGKRD